MARRGAVIEVTATGAAQKMQHELTKGERQLSRLIQQLMSDIGNDVQFFLQGHAPSRTEHLKLSIDSFLRRSTRQPQVVIAIDVVDPDHPYDYVNVTRFGRKAVVATRKAAKSATLGKRPIQLGRFFHRRSAAALQFAPGGANSGFIYRRRVGEYRPAVDWIGATEPEILAFVDAAMADGADEIQRALVGQRGVSFSGTRQARTRFL
jgi:hypothetical protein